MNSALGCLFESFRDKVNDLNLIFIQSLHQTMYFVLDTLIYSFFRIINYSIYIDIYFYLPRSLLTFWDMKLILFEKNILDSVTSLGVHLFVEV